MSKQKLFAATALLVLMVSGAIGRPITVSTVHAAGPILQQGTFNGQPVWYQTQSNGCTGTLIGVFGSSALKSFIQKEAADYCQQWKDVHSGSGVGGPDVEYSLGYGPSSTGPYTGGDSCPGVDYASDNSDTNEIGISDVFAPACTGTLARAKTKTLDTNLGPNIVLAIAQCPGANEPQNGALNPTIGAASPCLGNSQDVAGGCNASPSNTFPAPDNLSVQGAQLLWSGTAGDFSQVGGCLGATPGLQERVSGSGTRATYCLNVFGPGLDAQCASTAVNQTTGLVNADAPTTPQELLDVCGTDKVAPVDAAGTIGYVTRGNLVADGAITTTSTSPLFGCGYMQFGGKDAYNRNCDPGQVTAGVAQPYTGVNTQSGATTCNGDLQAVDGEYAAFGYEHEDVNAASSTNSAAKAFITFTQSLTKPYGNPTGTAGTPPDQVYQTKGFMRNCQMQVTRSVDGGPYAASAGASC